MRGAAHRTNHHILYSRCAFPPLVLVILTALALITGCATQPPVPDGPVLPDLSALPQTVLAGAALAQARSVALTNARVKGWRVRDSSGDVVLLERELARSSPQARALGPQVKDHPPRMQVEIHLREQPGGVLVALRAFVVTHPLQAPAEQRLDYTTDYQPALQASLASLQQDWQGSTRTVVTPLSAPDLTPPPAPAAPSPVTKPVARPPATPAIPTRPAARTNTTAHVAPVEERRSAPALARPAAVATVPALPAPEQRTVTPDMLPAPLPMPTSGLTPTTLPPTTPPAASNPMLALNQQQQGLWAYYAEQYARTHGCELTDTGSVLQEKNLSYEVHTVPCAAGNALLLKCQGGICQALSLRPEHAAQ